MFDLVRLSVALLLSISWVGAAPRPARVVISIQERKPSAGLAGFLRSAQTIDPAAPVYSERRARLSTQNYFADTSSTTSSSPSLSLPSVLARQHSDSSAAAGSDSDDPRPPTPPEGFNGWSLYSSAVVSLANRLSVVYTGAIAIGTPPPAPPNEAGTTTAAPQRFEVVFDTGSADLWVFSAQTQRTRRSDLHYYDHTRSTTYVPDNTEWSIEYGRGRCVGFLSRDVVQIGGGLVSEDSGGNSANGWNSSTGGGGEEDGLLSSFADAGAGAGGSTLQASSQVFAEALNWSEHFDDPAQPIDGICGLAFNAVARSKSNTLIDTLWEQKQIERKAFSFALTKGKGLNECGVNEVTE
jgi:hypothetical protein